MGTTNPTKWIGEPVITLDVAKWAYRQLRITRKKIKAIKNGNKQVLEDCGSLEYMEGRRHALRHIVDTIMFIDDPVTSTDLVNFDIAYLIALGDQDKAMSVEDCVHYMGICHIYERFFDLVYPASMETTREEAWTAIDDKCAERDRKLAGIYSKEVTL